MTIEITSSPLLTGLNAAEGIQPSLPGITGGNDGFSNALLSQLEQIKGMTTEIAGNSLQSGVNSLTTTIAHTSGNSLPPSEPSSADIDHQAILSTVTDTLTFITGKSVGAINDQTKITQRQSSTIMQQTEQFGIDTLNSSPPVSQLTTAQSPSEIINTAPISNGPVLQNASSITTESSGKSSNNTANTDSSQISPQKRNKISAQTNVNASLASTKSINTTNISQPVISADSYKINTSTEANKPATTAENLNIEPIVAENNKLNTVKTNTSSAEIAPQLPTKASIEASVIGSTKTITSVLNDPIDKRTASRGKIIEANTNSALTGTTKNVTSILIDSADQQTTTPVITTTNNPGTERIAPSTINNQPRNQAIPTAPVNATTATGYEYPATSVTTDSSDKNILVSDLTKQTDSSVFTNNSTVTIAKETKAAITHANKEIIDKDENTSKDALTLALSLPVETSIKPEKRTPTVISEDKQSTSELATDTTKVIESYTSSIATDTQPVILPQIANEPNPAVPSLIHSEPKSENTSFTPGTLDMINSVSEQSNPGSSSPNNNALLFEQSQGKSDRQLTPTELTSFEKQDRPDQTFTDLMTENSIPSSSGNDLIMPAKSTTDNKVEIPAMTRPLSHPDWNKELGDRIVWLNNRSIPTAEIRMNPEHLGPITVRINVTDDQASVVFTAQHAVVRETLEAAIPKLREMMSAQQLNLVDASVSQGYSSDQGRSSAQNFAQTNQGRNPEVTNPLIGDDNNEIDQAIDNGQAVVSQGLVSIYA